MRLQSVKGHLALAWTALILNQRAGCRYQGMAEHQITRLHALADALNIPLEKFWAAVPEGEPGEAVTLLRLWSAVSDSQARNRIIAQLRAEADRAGYEE